MPVYTDTGQVDRIHPRLPKLKAALAKIFKLDDETELDALLEAIQVLLYRSGYLLRAEVAERSRKRQLAVPREIGTAPQPSRGRGRPIGSAKLAARQFGLGLAQIWFEQTGYPPTRRFDWSTGKEYGPFREFVQLIVDILPQSIWMRPKGYVASVDYVVREGIAAFKIARRAPEEYRRRGLIDERRWLDSVTSF